MTETEKCVESLMMIFYRYGKEDDGKHVLTKKDLKKLLEAELPSFLTAQKNPKIVEDLMKDLDRNKDDKLDFEEFMTFIAGLSIACEKCYNMDLKKGKK